MSVATAENGRSVRTVASRPEPVAGPAAAERAWGVAAHLSGAVAIVVGPLLVARLRGRSSGYVREQAVEAATFQLGFLLVQAPLLLIGVLTFGLAAMLAVSLVLAWLITTLTAAAAVAGGERYRYPIRFHLTAGPLVNRLDA